MLDPRRPSLEGLARRLEQEEIDRLHKEIAQLVDQVQLRVLEFHNRIRELEHRIDARQPPTLPPPSTLSPGEDRLIG